MRNSQILEKTELKYSNIDIESCSIEQLSQEIERLKKLKIPKTNEEQAIKIFLNSTYGALASKYFFGFNIKIAESITLQGQDLIKWTSLKLNEWFSKWHTYTDIHQKLGVKVLSEIQEKENVIYNDTDSCYVKFSSLLKTLNQYPEDPTKFIIDLYKNHLSHYIKNLFEYYAKKFGTENMQDLEMENINYEMLLLKKKKYITHKAWKDSAKGGIFYKRLEKIEPKGVEIVQSSTPLFARNVLKDILKYLFSNNLNFDYLDFIKKLKEIKTKFIHSNINDISLGSSITDYEKFIYDDIKSLKINKGCPIHVRAAGVYNYILNNTKWGKKYQRIKSGDKIKYYYSKIDNNINENVFAFLPGNFPIEFAPQIDYDIMFEKIIIDPVNRFIKAMNYQEINPNLITKKTLF